MTPQRAYAFPLRPDYQAQLVVPRDLTVRDAERLIEFIRTLVMPSEPSEGGKHG
jgi:hypothetical protein